MSAGRAQYEVQIWQNKHWVLDVIFDTENAAVKAAQAMAKAGGGGFEEVRVIKSWMRADGSTTDSTVYSEKVSNADRPVNIAPIEDAPNCMVADDLYGVESRRCMGRLLRKYLDKFFITPTELLHCYRHSKTLAEKDNLLPSAVDRVATIQAKKTGEEYNKRRDELFRFVDSISARAKNIENSRSLPTINEGDFTAMVKSVDFTTGAEARSFHIYAALSQTLRFSRSWLDKLAALLDLDCIGTDDATFGHIDQLIGEILDAASAIQEVFGPQPCLGAAIAQMLDLSNGVLMINGREPHEPLAGLKKLFATRPMTQSRASLVDRVKKEIGGTGKLARNPEDEGQQFAEVIGRLLDKNGNIVGGVDMVEAIMQRTGLKIGASGETISPRERIAEVMTLIDDQRNKVKFLILVSETTFGKKHTQVVVDATAQIVMPCKSVEDLCYFRDPPTKKLRDVAGLQRQILGSGFPDKERASMADRLDTILADFIIREKIIEKMDNPNDVLRDRATRLVQFCASGMLTEGKALNMARERTLSYLRQPNFIGHFTESVSDPARKEEMIRDFYRLLAKAGMSG
jgi:hypothetical protein